MSRQQLVLIAATLLGSWLGMQAIHEAGHVIGAWVTNGRVERVVLHPLTVSRTDLADNPQPLLVAWAGPLFGSVVPLLLWSIASPMRMPGAFVLRFFAGFCLLGNGLYIGIGSFDRIGDCGDLIRNGAPVWTLWLFGAATAPIGLWLWHGQGRHFGMGSSRDKVHSGVMCVTLVAFFGLLAIGLLVGGE